MGVRAAQHLMDLTIKVQNKNIRNSLNTFSIIVISDHKSVYILNDASTSTTAIIKPVIYHNEIKIWIT